MPKYVVMYCNGQPHSWYAFTEYPDWYRRDQARYAKDPEREVKLMDFDTIDEVIKLCGGEKDAVRYRNRKQ